MGENVFAGAASRVIGTAAGSPFFLVKTRLQSYSPFLPVGTQHNYKNSFDCLSMIYRSEGIKGIYQALQHTRADFRTCSIRHVVW